jgi:hypothetical protein
MGLFMLDNLAGQVISLWGKTYAKNTPQITILSYNIDEVRISGHLGG